MDLAEADMISAEQISQKTVAEVQAVLNDVDAVGKVAKAIHDVSTNLSVEKFGGIVPCEASELKELKIDETVMGLLLNQVFGETELVIGLNARKLMVALDLFDWEESGAEERVDVKMALVPPNYVKSSLLTWIPQGEMRHFQELMEPLATAIGDHRSGFWGSLMKSLKKHFAPKEKDLLQKMAEKVSQFHKATRVGAAKKLRLCC